MTTSPTQDRGADCPIARAMFDADIASRALGISLEELRSGYARTSITVTDAMVNGYGITHGGYVFIAADTTFALACNSHEDSAVASRADIRFLRPTHLGDTLIAEAREVRRFGRNGIYDVTVFRGNEVIAEFRGDSRTLPAR